MKSKVVTISIVAATVILAGVAIFTAIRLYQLRQESVVPTAPESVPEAAPLEDEISESCEPLTFTVTERAPGLVCTKKKAYEDDARNEAESYYLISPITSGTELDPGNVFVYTLTYENTGTATVTGATFTDTLPPQLEFVDGDPNCTELSGVVSCTTGEVVPGGSSQKAVRVKVADNASPGNFTNTATLDPIEGDSSNCSITLGVTEPDEPTPTPTAPPATPTPTPASCNNTCSTDSDCQSGLDCNSGKCRNPSCTAETDCTCATPAPATPTPITQATPAPSLPDAGIPIPTLVGLGAGSLLLMLAILALAL